MSQEPLSINALLAEALKCGIPVAAFWEMTPRETLETIKAAVWRNDQEHRARVSLAWHTAMLTRAKRMPRLARLLGTDKAQRLEGAELEKRRAEFARMQKAWHN